MENTLLNKISDGVVLCDSTGKIIFCNSAVQKIIGRKEEELKGKNVQNLFQQKEFEKELQSFFELQNKNKLEYSLEYVLNDGTSVFLDFEVSQYNDEKNNYFVLIKDNTEKIKIKEIETECDIKTLNLNSFLFVVGHDFRNVFSQIMSLSAIMINGFDNFSSENIKQYLEMINKSSAKGFSLLEQLVKWGRLITDRDKFIYLEFDLKGLILKVINLKEEIINKKNITIDYSPIDINLFADYNYLFQAISNILDNAIKFSYSDSKIEIKTRKNKDKAEIIIEDKGKGMSEEALENIFVQPFKYIQTGTDGEVGEGIGMLLVSEIIRKNNGEINIESKKDIGTKVIVKIPLAK